MVGLIELGLVGFSSKARRVVLSLPNSAVVDEVVEGKDGIIKDCKEGDISPNYVRSLIRTAPAKADIFFVGDGSLMYVRLIRQSCG